MHVFAVDVGGTFIKFGVISDDTVIRNGKVKTPKNYVEFLNTVVNLYIENKDEEVRGIAISMPGRIDSDNGFAITGGSIEYLYEKNIALDIKKICNDVHISVENDGKCAALAESKAGNWTDCKDGIVVVLGTGVGGGIIKNHELHKGANDAAGEFSFIMPVSENVTNSLSYIGFELSSLTLGKKYLEQTNEKADEVSGEEFFCMVEQGNEIATKILVEYCYKLSIFLFNLQYIYDPEKILIGGGISAQPILLELVHEQIKKIDTQILNKMITPKVDICRFNNDANLIGASYVFQNKNMI